MSPDMEVRHFVLTVAVLLVLLLVLAIVVLVRDRRKYHHRETADAMIRRHNTLEGGPE